MTISATKDLKGPRRTRRSTRSQQVATPTSLLAALLYPVVEIMIRAGICRMSCAKNKDFVLQMTDGEVITVDHEVFKSVA